MNKQEAIRRVFEESDYESSIGIYIEYDKVVNIINQMDEPFDWQKTDWEAVEELDKVKIPKFVADWIEDNRDSFSEKHKLISMFLSSVKHSVKTQDCYQWSKTKGNMDKFMEALVNGYEIEEEPLYYAKVKGHELITVGCVRYWNYIPEEKRFIVSSTYGSDYFQTKMTKAEWNKLGINNSNADFEEVE